MAFSRATMILAVVDMLRRGDKQSVMACRQGSRPPERFAQALQPLCNLSHTSKQNAVKDRRVSRHVGGQNGVNEA